MRGRFLSRPFLKRREERARNSASVYSARGAPYVTPAPAEYANNFSRPFAEAVDDIWRSFLGVVEC